MLKCVGPSRQREAERTLTLIPSPMKRVNTTNVVLSIFAAEVVLLTVKAFADRQAAADQSLRPVEGAVPPTFAGPFLLVNVLQQTVGLLGRLLFGYKESYRFGDGRDDSGLRATHFALPNRGKYQARIDNADHDEEAIEVTGDMQGFAEKLKDPAWAGVLAANDGNVSLTNAERAVPMPNSAKLVQRLDRNPFVGKGMKDHSRGPH